MARYKPSFSDTVALSTGKQLHSYFDHPNHNGFDPTDHKLAADWHDRQIFKHFKAHDYPAVLFHSAQKTLHERAATGKPTKMKFTPSDEFFGQLEPRRKEFWTKWANTIRTHNKQLAVLEPYRLGHMAGESEPAPTLTKSRTVDLQEVKRVEQDREPPSSPLEAKEVHHPESKKDTDNLMKKIMSNRHAERHGGSASSDEDNTPELPADHQELIRQIIADRRGGRS